MPSPLRKLDGAVGSRETVQFDPRKIVIESNHNPRSRAKLRENVDRLKPEIKAAGGVYQPLWVRKDGDKAILIDGESRLTACKELIAEYEQTNGASGCLIQTVPTIYFAGMMDEAERVMLAITANSGKPLEKWEHGAAFARLYNLGYDSPRIAAKLGFSARYVTEAITLAETPEEMREMLASGQITTGAAMAEVKAVGATQATKNLKDAVAANGGAPIKRERAKSNAELIAAAEQLINEAMPDQESPAYMTVTIQSFNDLKAALKLAMGGA